MPNELRQYPAYKDSSVAWLGQVPENWSVRRIKSLFHEKDERRRDGCGLLLSLMRTRGIVPHSEASNRMAGAEDLSKYKICRAGDLVMNRMQAWSGMFAVSSLDGVVSPDYSVFHATGSFDAKYFALLFRTPQAVTQFAQLSKGIGSGFNRLYTEDFGSVLVAAPPTDEQVAIVRYLDHADRKVRHAIRARQQLIKLLTEQKQAIIQHAVTRGLNPNVRLKPSGVPWLGDVPQHWQILRLKNACQRIVGGSTPRSDKIEYWNGDVVWVTPIDVTCSQRLDTSLRRITREGLNSCSATLVPAGSIIVTCRAPVGKVAIAATELCTNQGCKAIVLRSEMLTTAFGALLLRTLEPELQSLANGTTFYEIPLHKLACVPIPVPTTGEQSAIVRYLDGATASLDKAVDAARREIDLLREYRTRLIADVVTGKLDVRDAATYLPDEPEEQPEPLDEEPVAETSDLDTEESDGDQSEHESRNA